MVKGFIFNKKNRFTWRPVCRGKLLAPAAGRFRFRPRSRDPQIRWLRAKVLTVETAHLLFLGRSEKTPQMVQQSERGCYFCLRFQIKVHNPPPKSPPKKSSSYQKLLLCLSLKLDMTPKNVGLIQIMFLFNSKWFLVSVPFGLDKNYTSPYIFYYYKVGPYQL